VRLLTANLPPLLLLILERTPPVFDMLNRDIGSFLGGEVAAEGFDEVVFGICGVRRQLAVFRSRGMVIGIRREGRLG
jgi:hypothetical protein